MDIFAQHRASGWVILLILQSVKNYSKTHKGFVCHLSEYWNWLHPGCPVSPLTILPARNWMRHSLGWPVTFTRGQQSSRNLLDMHRCVKYTLPCTPGLALWISNGNTEPHHWDNFLNNRMRFSCNCSVWDWKIWWWNLRMFQAVPIYCSVFLTRNTNKIFYHWNALI